jgi:transcriptional regulator GlxA family with amidase domain
MGLDWFTPVGSFCFDPEKETLAMLNCRCSCVQVGTADLENQLCDGKSIEDSRIHTAVWWLGRQSSATAIDVNEIAKVLNLSNSRFRHLFRQHMGITPSRYHKLLRLEKARHLLRESFLNVKQVMAEVGWSDESHFCRDYKRVYGECPSKSKIILRRAFTGVAGNGRK